jgi:hypothetical protein
MVNTQPMNFFFSMKLRSKKQSLLSFLLTP